MSCNFSVTGTTKEEAKAAVWANKSVCEWKYCPLLVADGICKAIDGMAEPQADAKIVISTHGHANPDGSGGKQHGDTASISISYGPRE